MGASHRGYADTETGEVFDLVAVPRSESKTYNRGGFAMAMLAEFDRIANEGWNGTEYQVFIKLVARLDYENYLHLDVSELAAEMKRPRENVSRAISSLVKRGVLHRGPRVGRSYTYRLDPGTVWRGKPEARRRVQAEIDRRGWSVVEGESRDEPGHPDGHEEDPLPGL